MEEKIYCTSSNRELHIGDCLYEIYQLVGCYKINVIKLTEEIIPRLLEKRHYICQVVLIQKKRNEKSRKRLFVPQKWRRGTHW